MSILTHIKSKSFTPYKDKVFVKNLDHGPQVTAAGVIIPDDNMTNRGIRARWGQVWAIGPDVKDLDVGQWILIEHGRWTERMTIETEQETVEVWQVEYPKSVLMSSDQKPKDSKALPNPKYQFSTRTLQR